MLEVEAAVVRVSTSELRVELEVVMATSVELLMLVDDPTIVTRYVVVCVKVS